MFTAPNTPTEESTAIDTEIANSAFYPTLKVGDFAKAMRVEYLAAEPRIAHCLKHAMLDVNRQLAHWTQSHIDEGQSTLANIATPVWMPENGNTELYLRAVWSLAKAQLIERWRDYDSTASGDKKTEKSEASADDLRRDSAWAISDLTGQFRSLVELI